MVPSCHRDRRNSSTFVSMNYYDDEENMKNQTMRKMFSTCAINSDNRQFFNFSMFNGHKTYRLVVYFVQNRLRFMHTCTLVKINQTSFKETRRRRVWGLWPCYGVFVFFVHIVCDIGPTHSWPRDGRSGLGGRRVSANQCFFC